MRQRLIDAPVMGRIWVATGNVGNGKNTYSMELLNLMARTCMHGTPNEVERISIDGEVHFKSNCPYCIRYGKQYFGRPMDQRLHVKANFPIDVEWCKRHGVVFELLHDWTDFINIKKGNYHQLWLIDEPNQFIFDSRESLSKRNKLGSRKVQRCRHFNADVLFLTQLNSMVDLRGRRLFQRQVWALTPSRTGFNYVWIADGGDTIIPMAMKKSMAKKYLFPYFRTDNVDDNEVESDEIEGSEIEA